MEDRSFSSVHLDDGRVDEVTSGWKRGAAVRVTVGDSTGHAYTTDLSAPGLLLAAEAAGAIGRDDRGAPPVAVTEGPRRPDSAAPEIVERSRKVELLLRADDAARSMRSVRQVSGWYSDLRRRICVANSEGLFSADDVLRSQFSVTAVARSDAVAQTGMESVARGSSGQPFEFHAEEVARVAARRAVTKLAAGDAPTGVVPVVFAAGRGAVLFHEACGHGLEADSVEKQASVYHGRVGEHVAGPAVTLVDDGGMAGEWGAAAIDDEGHPTTRNVLVDRGVLTGYMWDLNRARKAGRHSSGNGRRETYRHTPMARMTNTYLLAGQEDPEELVRQTRRGLYVAQLSGGEVNTATGDFVFGMTEAYLIENGQVTRPVRDANLVGNGPEVLRNIDAVACDFAMAPGGGMCGKSGQSLPVGMGQPTLRVTGITVGGTAR